MADKYLGYKSNPYSPFPAGMAAYNPTSKNVAPIFCQVPGSESDCIGVVSIYSRPLNVVESESPDQPLGWKKQASIDFSEASDWVYRLEYYELKSDELANIDHNWLPSDHAFNYRAIFFGCFYDLVDYVAENWGVDMINFKRDYEMPFPVD